MIIPPRQPLSQRPSTVTDLCLACIWTWKGGGGLHLLFANSSGGRIATLIRTGQGWEQEPEGALYKNDN